MSPFSANLSQAALETLAIVAYKQPITRIEIDEIRGVQSSSLLQRLLIRGLVKEMGREETPGRPIIYGTTEYFMNYFGLQDIQDLPSADILFQMQQDDPADLFKKDRTEDKEETDEN
ncbi:SMC-Scp complex subunit ScpB [Jeotgalibaca sp. MA1X17-3]|nr:SMC-Scp complex subunit ScpB [Jeotgalibaca sp. MA1X17-3]